MARSTIELVFQAVDKASDTANKIGQAVDNINKKADLSFASAMKIGAAFSAGFLAVQNAANAAASAINFVGSRIREASSANQELISTTGMLQGLLGVSFKEAGTIVDKLNDSIFKTTNALPGATKEYVELANSIVDNLIPAAKDAKGVLDTDKLIKTTTEMTAIFGLLGKGAGTTRENVTIGLTRAIGGTASLSELGRIDLFERNQALMNKIKEELAKRGAKELKDVNEATRIEILRKAGGTLITPETLAALTDTLDARLENLAGELFDPQRGMFGFLRKIDARGGQTVLDAVKKAFDSVKGIFDKIGEIAKKLGISDTAAIEIFFDIFSAISSFADTVKESINVDAIAKSLKSIQGYFTAISEAASRFMSGDLGFDAASKAMSDNLGSEAASKLMSNDLGSEATSKFMSGDLGALIDIGVYAQLLGEDLAKALKDWIMSIDWAGALSDLGELITVATVFTANFVASFGAGLLDILSSMCDAVVDTTAYGIVGIIQTLGEVITEAFNSTVDIVAYGIIGTFDTFFEFVSGLVTNTASLIQSGVESTVGWIVSAVQSAVDTIAQAVTNAFNSAASTLSGIISGITFGVISGVQNAVQSMASAVINAFNSAASSIQGIVSSIGQNIVNAVNSAISILNNFIASLPQKAQAAVNAVSNPVGAVAGAVVGAVTGRNYSNASTISAVTVPAYSTNVSKVSMGGDNFYITINTQSNPNNVTNFANELVATLDEVWKQYKSARVL